MLGAAGSSRFSQQRRRDQRRISIWISRSFGRDILRPLGRRSRLGIGTGVLLTRAFLEGAFLGGLRGRARGEQSEGEQTSDGFDLHFRCDWVTNSGSISDGLYNYYILTWRSKYDFCFRISRLKIAKTLTQTVKPP